MSLRNVFVRMVYADHNNSKSVRNAIDRLLANYKVGSIILNIGSGDQRIREDIRNLDIFPGPNVDIVGSAEKIPLEDSSVDLILSQEAFEHIPNAKLALSECRRCLKKDGKIYFQVPFIIGYHPGPTDFIRFSREGVVEFLESSGFAVDEINITVGGATGFYRIAVEFFAILFSGPISRLYIPFKSLFSILLYPCKFLDPWFNLSKQRDRIPGGYYAIARRL